MLVSAWTAAAAAATQPDPRRAEVCLEDIQPAPAPESRPPAAALADHPDVQELCQEAEEALKGGDAHGALRQLAACPPTGAMRFYEVEYLRARALALRGRVEEARQAATRAIGLRPEAADAHYLLGTLHALQGRFDAAIAHFRSVTLAAQRELDNPRVTAAWYHLGRLLEREGYLLAAVQAFERFDRAVWETHTEHRLAEELRPLLEAQPHGALERRVELLRRLGRSTAAVETLRAALPSFPDDDTVLREYVRALIEADRAQEALAICQQRGADDAAGTPPTLTLRAARAAGRLSEFLEPVQRDLATAEGEEGVSRAIALAGRLECIGANREAASLWEAIAARRPADADVALALASARRAAGQWREAIDGLIEFFRTHPQAGRPGVQRLRSWLALERRPGPAAEPADQELLRWIQDHLRRPGGDFARDLVLGSAAAAAGHRELADSLLASAAEARPELALAPLVRGYCAAAGYRWAEARAQAEAAVAIDRDLAAAHHLLGLAHDGLDENTAAENALRQAIRLAPGDATCLVALARHLQRTGNSLGAQRYYAEALAADPGNGEAFEGLIESYLADDKLEVARARLEKARLEDLPPDVVRRVRTTVRYAHGPRQELVEELERQFEQFPQDTQTGLKLVAAYLVLDRTGDAERVMQRLRQVGAEDEQVLLTSGLLQRRCLDFGGAVRTLETLAERFPNRTGLLNLLAEAQLYDFQVEASRTTLRRLIERASDQTTRRRALLLLLDSHLRFMDEAGALKVFEELPKELLSTPEMQQERWLCLVRAGRASEALEPLARRLDEAPGDRAALATYVTVCAEAGAYDQAEQRLRARLQEDRDDPWLVELLMRVLLDAGRPESALRVLEQYTATTWSTALVRRVWMARCYERAGQWQSAISTIESLLSEQLVQADRDRHRALREELVRLLVRAGEFDRALAEIDAAARDAQEGGAADGTGGPAAGQGEVSDDVLQQKLAVYQAADRVEDYIRVAQVLLEARPRDATLNNDLGYTWVDRGENLEKATQMIRLAVAAEPLNAAYLDSLGWARYKAGEFAEAREQLARAVRLRDGQDAVLFDHLGDAEYRLGDVDAARRSWKKAVELCEAEKRPERRERNARTEQAVRMKLATLERGEKPAVAPLAREER